MSHELSRIAARLFNAPLLVLPDVAETIAENLAARFGSDAAALVRPVGVSGGSQEEPDEDLYSVDNGVATIPVRGELVNRGSWLNSMSGLTSYESLQNALRMAAADPRVMSVVLDMDSPGGEAAGAMETADEVRELSRSKPVTAFVNSLAASAGYAIAAGAKEIVVPPSGTVGSIGVVWLHRDVSQQQKDRGVKTTLLTAGAFKGDGNPFAPLDPESRERIQASINDTYALFLGSVGKHRPQLGVEGARKTEAGLYMGGKAVEAGLADRVATLSQLLKSRASAARFSGFSLMNTKSAAQPGAEVAAVSSAAVDSTQPDDKEAAMADASALEAANKDGANSMQARIKAIMNSDEAKDKQTLAAHFAYDTEMSADSAKVALKAAAAETKPASRMDSVPRIGLTADGGAAAEQDPKKAIDDMWTGIATSLNKKAGFAK